MKIMYPWHPENIQTHAIIQPEGASEGHGGAPDTPDVAVQVHALSRLTPRNSEGERTNDSHTQNADAAVGGRGFTSKLLHELAAGDGCRRPEAHDQKPGANSVHADVSEKLGRETLIAKLRVPDIVLTAAPLPSLSTARIGTQI